jgi:DNA-directed RNA polymerase subunit RPC12/RpoP
MKFLKRIGTSNKNIDIAIYHCELCKKSFEMPKEQKFYYCPICGADFLYEEGRYL